MLRICCHAQLHIWLELSGWGRSPHPCNVHTAAAWYTTRLAMAMAGWTTSGGTTATTAGACGTVGGRSGATRWLHGAEARYAAEGIIVCACMHIARSLI